ncbi:caspase family protein [Paenibacillus sp. 1001270B_150601_E10]|uniref:caspase family protein n=1 Tax=Paenibacillus sp. 1001270B_150601_E10 TaxID=2787079 RepID=UPI001E5463E3|nr:caspase family protein [Paenibacillus sp. 1001270B_150601_E10]
MFEGNNDVALLYFSGHGLINSTGGYIVTTDYKTYDEGIAMDTILNLANRSGARDKIVILDCCHSGSFGSPSQQNGLTQLSDGLTILTASRSSESAFAIDGQGVFTSLLLDALHGGAADLRGYVTPGSLYSYIDEALGAWDQRPVFKTNVSRFTHIRRVEPIIPLITIRKISDYFKEPTEEFKLDPSYEFSSDEPKEENVAVFKDLQKYESVGLVVPVDAKHMYFAAMESKSCRLTALGYQYWRLVYEGKV